MAEFVFTSPGVKFRETDLSFVTRNVGVTTLGLVGETLKGPAFEPIFIQDKNQFLSRLGGQSTKKFSDGRLQYQLPYVANAYLSQSNQLWVTRVLGLSGYDAGSAWAITLSANYNPSTVVTGTTSTPQTASFTNFNYRGDTITAVGQSGTTVSDFTKSSVTGFTATQYKYTVTAFNATVGSGTVSFTTQELSASNYTDYENMLLGVIRSRGVVNDVPNAQDSTPTFFVTGITITQNNTTTDFYNTFTITTQPISGFTSESYTVSFNPNSPSYIANVLGTTPSDKSTQIYIEFQYPELVSWLYGEDIAYAVSDTAVKLSSFNDYKTKYQTPSTPWVVSELKGNQINRLFKFISISDGNSANSEIKISILNIDPITAQFDVYIRDFNDTDENPIILESFSRCSLMKSSNNYIGAQIGTSDGEYSLKSKYVYLEMALNNNPTSFPCGFEGYPQWNTTSSNVKSPKMVYKTSYSSTDRLRRTYLGISEKAYSTAASIGKGINQNYFNFIGNVSSAQITKSNGFHLDSGATGNYPTIGTFSVGVGELRDFTSIDSPTEPYFDKNTRKFTLVPCGGFDGWNAYRTTRTYGDNYRKGGIYQYSQSNDFQAWELAVSTFANPENVTINLFATPGINWSDENILVQNNITMIETERTDSLYIIDSPDVGPELEIGQTGDVSAASNVVDLLESAGINSSYACTYFPYIQIKDTQNNANVYIPPTGEAVKSMAYTDNTTFPWFAPAGINRGVTSAIKSKYKLSQSARDILYAGRINPMADYNSLGTAILGQKTLQVADTLLTRINVRRLILQLKVLISNVAIRLLFEQADQQTIDRFLAQVNPILDTVRRERGLRGFEVIMDDSNNTPESLDRNELYGEIKIKPISAVEFIGLTFTITPSGASFDDVS